jgi:hypothetical protein
MKYIEEYNATPVLELTRRNLEGLLAKLDDPDSARTLMDPDFKIYVKAVEDEEHYADRPEGLMFTNGVWH